MAKLEDLKPGMIVRASDGYLAQLSWKCGRHRRERGKIYNLRNGFVRVKWDKLVVAETLHPDWVEPYYKCVTPQ